MGMQARQQGEKWARPGGSPGFPGAFPRAMGLAAMVLSACLLMPAPMAAQATATGQATVRIGEVSRLDVEHEPGSAVMGGPGDPGRDSGLRTETFRVRVRANHRWKVVLAAEPGAATALRVRTLGVSGAGGSQYVEPGSAIEVASGERGDRVVEVEVQWQSSAYPSAATLPIRYSLASADD